MNHIQGRMTVCHALEEGCLLSPINTDHNLDSSLKLGQRSGSRRRIEREVDKSSNYDLVKSWTAFCAGTSASG